LSSISRAIANSRKCDEAAAGSARPRRVRQVASIELAAANTTPSPILKVEVSSALTVRVIHEIWNDLQF
jgi:hypothetical protein